MIVINTEDSDIEVEGRKVERTNRIYAQNNSAAKNYIFISDKVLDFYAVFIVNADNMPLQSGSIKNGKRSYK